MKTRKTDFGEPQPPLKRSKPKTSDSVFIPFDQLPALPPSPTDSNLSSVSHITTIKTKNLSDFKPTIHPSLLSQPTNQPDRKMAPTDEKPADNVLSANKKEDLDELKDQMKNLQNILTFEHLAKDGSNFVDWREETSRTIYRTTGLEDYWTGPFPVIDNRLKREQNRAAMTICESTIDTSLRRIIRPCKTAEEIMKVLQSHFQKGGRTAQFAIFQKLISLRPDPSEDDILEHTSKIDALISELQSTGFKCTFDSLAGLFYQLNLLADTTKAVNKELDAQFESKSGSFTSVEVQNIIQVHMAREKIASKTATMSNLAASIDALSVNALKFRTPQRSHPPSSNSQRFYSTRTSNRKINWKDGPMHITDNNAKREESILKPISIPDSAIAAVKAHRPQCFYCLSFSHGYNDCPNIVGGRERTAAHYNDWRRVKECNYMYSLDVLFPHLYKLPPSNTSRCVQSSQPRPAPSRNIRVHAIEAPQDEPTQVHASAINWNSDGIK